MKVVENDQFFKKKKFKIYVVNSDGLKFSEVNWPKVILMLVKSR